MVDRTTCPSIPESSPAGVVYMRLRLLGTLVGTLVLAGTMAAQKTSTSGQSAPTDNNTRDTKDTASSSKPARKTHLKWGFDIGAGYTHVSGFDPWYAYSPYGRYGYYPYYAYGFWDPFWGPASYYPVDVTYSRDKGELQLKADPKDADVYIDGAYAGKVQHLKSIWLEPGAYNLSFSAPGRESYQRRVYVLTGKRLTIPAKLVPQNAPTADSEN